MKNLLTKLTATAARKFAVALSLAAVLILGGLVIHAQSYNSGTGADGWLNTSLAFFQTAGDSTLRLPATAQYVFNGTTWDRARGTSGSVNSAVAGMAATGAAVSGNPVYVAGIDTAGNARPQIFNTTGSPSIGLLANAADATANSSGGFTPCSSGASCYQLIWPQIFNGTTWDRIRSASLAAFTAATTLTARNSIGAQIAEKGSRFTVVSTPAANSQATASIAAEASVRHVVDTVCFSASSNAAVTAANGTVDIRDGATGAGTVIAQFRVAIQVAAGAGIQIVPPYCVSGLNLTGTTNTALTAEFSAGVTGATESVTLTGFNVN